MARLSRVARVCLGSNSPTLANAKPRGYWLGGSLPRVSRVHAGARVRG